MDITTLKLPNGDYRTVFDVKALIELVGEMLGREAETILYEHIMELQKEADYTSQKLNTDLASYETSLDEMYSTLNDVLDNMDKLRNCLDEKRMNRKAMQDIVSRTMRLIHNQI